MNYDESKAHFGKLTCVGPGILKIVLLNVFWLFLVVTTFIGLHSSNFELGPFSLN